MSEVNLLETAKKLAEQNAQSNPAASLEKPKAERRRIPMTEPTRKLEVPEMPGYHLQWILGTPQRIQQALNASYTFVTNAEVQTNNQDIAGDVAASGNTDLGDRVSILEGSGLEHAGQAVRLYLMKQRQEDYLEDQAISQRAADRVADSLTGAYQQGRIGGAAPGETGSDMSTRYVDSKRTQMPELFRRKR